MAAANIVRDDLKTTIAYVEDVRRARTRPVDESDDARDERQERESASLLLPGDVRDLSWFFGLPTDDAVGKESALGIRSTWGEQLERWAMMREADSQVTARANAKKEAMRAWVASGKHPNAYGSPRWDEETVHGRETPPSLDAWKGLADLHGTLRHTKRARFIRERLVRAGTLPTMVLQTHFGPPLGEWPAPITQEEHEEKHAGVKNPPKFTFNSLRETARKKFGEYVDLTVIVVRVQSWFEGETTPATKLIMQRLGDQLWVHKTKRQTITVFRNAARAYATACGR